MGDLKEKLDYPITCTSSSETYKILQDHMVRTDTSRIKVPLCFLSQYLVTFCVFKV